MVNGVISDDRIDGKLGSHIFYFITSKYLFQFCLSVMWSPVDATAAILIDSRVPRMSSMTGSSM